MTRWKHIAAALALLASATGASATGADAQAGDVHVQDPWARASAGMTAAGAAFMTLRNEGSAPDRLVAASSPVAGRAELHTHIAEGDVMRMRAVDSIAIPAGTTVELRPGGLHVMLMNLREPLQTDESFPLTLSFENGGDVTVEVSVLAPGAMGAQGAGMDHGQSNAMPDSMPTTKPDAKRP